jgi:hypothetical protein
MKPKIALRKALNDPQLLGAVLGDDSWHDWRALLLAANGELLTPSELEAFKRHTGRKDAPNSRVDELWCVIGRRGGKSQATAAYAVYLAAFGNYAGRLSHGEQAVVVLVAADRKQAKVLLGYCRGALEATPMMRQLIQSVTKEAITLTNGVTIEVHTGSFRRIRGRTAAAALCDEIGFWYSEESANPDAEVLAALRPALATLNGPLVAISSPHARKGELWTTFKKHYGEEGDPSILVAQGTSRSLNPTLSQKVVDRAMERDAAVARAEYLAEFRTDVESLISQEAVAACVDAGVRERAFERKHSYVAFIDPSGGSSDSMTMAIAHREGETLVLDLIREHHPPFSPEQVVAEFSSTIRKYRCSQAFGDRYAGEWVVEQFRKCGVHYEPSEQTRSELYIDLLPIINSRAVGLLDHERLMVQLVSLERTSVRGGGREKVDHAKGCHDDVANAVAGAVVLTSQDSGYSPQQRFRDNAKLAAAYKRMAMSVA